MKYIYWLVVLFFITTRGLAMEISMPNVADGGMLPVKYTGDGNGISPPLNWKDVPHNAKSLVLICEDPDAPSGMYTHWIVYNLPVNILGLEEGAKNLPQGVQFGLNTAQQEVYVPPTPPSGIHRYYFRLYALDTTLTLKNPQRAEILATIKGHVIASTSLVTKYQSKS